MVIFKPLTILAPRTCDNLMRTSMTNLLDLIQSAKVYDLAQPYFIGMPHHPVHPPYLFGLVKKHGEFVSSIGASSASEALALGAHVGTHIDALCHFSRGGKLCDGAEVAQSYTGGMERLSVDTMAPIFRRGVLLDIAGWSIRMSCRLISSSPPSTWTPPHALKTWKYAPAMSCCSAPAGL